MVGVVGSSPIAPTIDSSAAQRTTERHGYDTANAQGNPLRERELARRRCHGKVRLVRTFLFLESAMPKITIARRRRQGVSPRRSPSPRSPPRSAPASPRPRWPASVDGKLVDTSHAIDRDAVAGHRHRQGCRRARGAAPFDRAPAGLRGEGAVSRRAGDDRPRDRGRLLLRFLVQAPVHARGPRGHREEDGRAREEGRARHAQADAARRRGRVFQGAGRALQGRDHRVDSRRRGRSRSTPRASSPISAAARTCRRPASSRSSS